MGFPCGQSHLAPPISISTSACPTWVRHPAGLRQVVVRVGPAPVAARRVPRGGVRRRRAHSHRGNGWRIDGRIAWQQKGRFACCHPTCIQVDTCSRIEFQRPGRSPDRPGRPSPTSNCQLGPPRSTSPRGQTDLRPPIPHLHRGHPDPVPPIPTVPIREMPPGSTQPPLATLVNPTWVATMRLKHFGQAHLGPPICHFQSGKPDLGRYHASKTL
jgi:hypothetical protein